MLIPVRSNGNFARSLERTNRDTKPGKAIHGDWEAALPGSQGATTRPSICFTGVLAIQPQAIPGIRVPGTICTRIA